MDIIIITMYCLCDDYLRSIKFQDRKACKMTTAEIMLIILVGMRFYSGNLEQARIFLMEYRFLTNKISKSRLNERMHSIPDAWWQELLLFIEKWCLHMGLPNNFIIDSFPVAACQNIRISRCHLYQSEDFRGYTASKRTYFYGLKVTLVVTTDGRPVLFWLSPGKDHDVTALKEMSLNLPAGSTVYGDPAYLDEEFEKKLKSESGINLVVQRKSNSLKAMTLEDYVNVSYWRKKVETAISSICKLLPKTIHAVTAKGFELKVVGFLVAFATTFLTS